VEVWWSPVVETRFRVCVSVEEGNDGDSMASNLVVGHLPDGG
jgi:hypothetical protein